ncbi:MAG: FAD-dependent oxidoreductase, partial [Dehalococcoidia bacterium]|nr:FAD-dependent oxidoreductase [Dehalococcoidia bacterium]
GGYIASKADGLIYAGTTEERVGYDDRPTTEARERIMGLALDILPFLEGARLALQTACLRPLSADGLPIIGRAPGWEGVYVATGAGRKGILLGPAMGRAVADLIVRENTQLSVQEFSVGRFSDPSA